MFAQKRVSRFSGSLRYAVAILVLLVASQVSAQFIVGHHQKISATEGAFGGDLSNNDRFSVPSRLDDMDGDGVVEMAVGARGDDDGGTNRGAVWILFLNADGTTKSEVKISAAEGRFDGVLDNNDGFGWSVESLGDLDGDGPSVAALAVGAALDDDGGDGIGATWILFLGADGSVASHQKISATEGGFSGELSPEDWFGYYLASLGDLDGDGVEDLAVGAPGDNDGGTDQGAIWILFLNADGTVKSHQKISETEGGFTGILDPYHHFGVSLACPGDLDGDGIADLATGTNIADEARGAVWILFLNTDGTVRTQQKISHREGGFSGELEIEDQFGWSMTELGDLDGDDVEDLAVGAWSDDDGGLNRGALWVLYLNENGTVKSHQKISNLESGFTGVLDDDDQFSVMPEALGDLDGDGVLDLAVGAENDDDGGTNRGAVWMLFLNPDPINAVDPDEPVATVPEARSHLVAGVPNPFNPRTTIHFELSQQTPASIGIFDVVGHLVRRFDLGTRPAGHHTVQWDGLDHHGRQAPNGTYLVRLDTPESQDAIRVSLIK